MFIFASIWSERCVCACVCVRVCCMSSNCVNVCELRSGFVKVRQLAFVCCLFSSSSSICFTQWLCAVMKRIAKSKLCVAPPHASVAIVVAIAIDQAIHREKAEALCEYVCVFCCNFSVFHSISVFLALFCYCLRCFAGSMLTDITKAIRSVYFIIW